MNELKKFQKNKNENIQAMSGDNDLKSFFELETPLREVGLPKNMADAILFLCTTEYLTGSDLNVDGGRFADGAMGSNAS